MGEEEVAGIGLGLDLDTSGWSAGIAKARAEVGVLKQDLKSLGVAGRINIARQQAQLSGQNAVSPQFQTSRGAVQQLRVDVNSHLRAMAQTGEAVTVPIRLGRVPYATMRNEIIRGLGEIPVTIRLSGISGGQGALAALISTSTGESMGKAQSTIESAAASRGIPRRAMGGSVMPNTPYLVGEHGRAEMFVPRGAGGKIVGSSELQRLMAAAARLQPHNVAGGKSWYSTAGSYAASAAERYGVPLKMAQGLLAALSVGTEWNSNKTKFERILAARASGSPIPYNDTKFVALRFAGEILRGADPAHVFRTSPKVSQFYAGISGNRDALVLDRWATRTMKGWQPGMPTGGAWDRPPRRGPAREAAEAAWREAAKSTGLSPAEFQAALWLQEKEQGQLALGLASGGRVAPGQRGMFEPVPRPSFCSTCGVNVVAGGMGRHQTTDSHQRARRTGHRRVRSSPFRSLKKEARIAALQQARHEPDENDYRRSLEDSMSTTELGASAQFDLGENRPYEGEGTFIHRMARGGFEGGVPNLRRLAAQYNQSHGLKAPATGFYHEINPDFSRRTAAAYEALPGGSSESDVAAYRAFAAETEAQYRLLRKAGYTFSPSRTDPYKGSGTTMQMAGRDVVRNKHLSAFASALEHPLLSKRENWIFRGVHDLFGHLAEGFSIGPRGEFNAAAAHSQMYSPLAQQAMLAETHGQNSVVNFSSTALPGYGGRSIAQVNAAKPGSIYAEQKARALPPELIAEFNRLTGRADGGEVYLRRRAQIGHARAGHGAGEDLRLEALRDAGSSGSAQQMLDYAFGRLSKEIERPSHGSDAAIAAALARLPKILSEPGMGRRFATHELLDQTVAWPTPREGQPFWRAMTTLGYDFSDVTGRYNKDSQAPWRRPFRNTKPGMGIGPGGWSKNAAGGGVPPGTVIAGEIGRELFVPRSEESLIPSDVAAQLPGGGSLSARIAAREAALHPWKPEWLRRGAAKDFTGRLYHRAGGGMVDIAPGAHLWQAPEDGWIIPNRLMNKVPRRQDGGPYAGYKDTPHGYKDPATGRWVSRSTVAAAQREQEAGYLSSLPAPDSPLGQAMLAASPGVPKGITDLSEFQAFKRVNPNVRGLTPRSVLGGILGRVASGKERAEAENALREAAATLRGFHNAAGDVEPLKLWTGFMEKAQARVNENAQALSKFTTASQKSSRTFLDLTAQQAKAQKDLKYATETKADIERQEITIRLAERKLELTPASQLRQFAVLQGGFTLYQLALTGVSKALQLGEMAADPFIDRLNGFTGVATDITAKLAQQTRELGGNAPAGIATAAQGTSIGSAGLSYLNQNLTGPTTAKAAATSESAAADLRRSALSFATGASTATGLFGPYGGIGPVINGEQLGSSPGLTDTMGKEIADFNNRRAAASGNFDLGAVLGSTLAGAGGGAAGGAVLGAGVGSLAGGVGALPGAVIGGIGGTIAGAGAGFSAGFQTQQGNQLHASQQGVAAVDQLETATVSDWNDAVKTGSQYLGDNASSLQYMTKQQLIAAGDIKDTDWGGIVDQFKSVGTAAGDTATDLENMTGGKNGVVIWNTATNKLIGAGESLYAGAKEYTKTASQLAQGAVLGSQQAFFQPHLQEFLGGVKQGILQGTFQRQVQIPGALGLQLAANPFSPASTGFAPDQQKALGAKLAAIDKEQNDLTAMGEAGLKAQSSFVHQWALTVGPQALNSFSQQFLAGQVQGPPTQTIGPGGQVASPDQNLAATYDKAVADVGKYGAAIAGLNAEISNTEAGLAFKQYGNDIRILNRSLRDARSLLRSPSASQLTAGADNAGAIQRAEFDVSRAQQSLGFQLTQRQINFQTAVAGFQAPGITGQERAARTIEAQTEASFAQKQLNLQREQFKLEGVAFVVEARRAVVDVRASIDLERAARDAQTKILADQKLISTDQVRLSQAQAVATSILDQASGNYQSATDLAAARVKEFGGNIQDATNQLRALLGLSPENTSYNQQGQIVTTSGGVPAGRPPKATASGINAYVSSATGFVAGEAGVGEHVVVMRNPTYGSVAAAGVPGSGGGGVTIGPINITGNTIKDTVDLHDIATQLTDEIERRLGQKARVLLPRSASF